MKPARLAGDRRNRTGRPGRADCAPGIHARVWAQPRPPPAPSRPAPAAGALGGDPACSPRDRRERREGAVRAAGRPGRDPESLGLPRSPGACSPAPSRGLWVHKHLTLSCSGCTGSQSSSECNSIPRLQDLDGQVHAAAGIPGERGAGAGGLV